VSPRAVVAAAPVEICAAHATSYGRHDYADAIEQYMRALKADPNLLCGRLRRATAIRRNII
jgi:hypothetical protein